MNDGNESRSSGNDYAIIKKKIKELEEKANNIHIQPSKFFKIK
jgi:hypothetical protein